MSIKIRLKDLEINHLNQQCLLLVGRFTRELKSYKSIGLKVQDKDVLMEIARQARRTRNPELKSIYQNLRSEIIKSVHTQISEGKFSATNVARSRGLSARH